MSHRVRSVWEARTAFRNAYCVCVRETTTSLFARTSVPFSRSADGCVSSWRMTEATAECAEQQTPHDHGHVLMPLVGARRVCVSSAADMVVD